MIPDLPRIAVFPPERFSRCRRMLEALGDLYAVEFVPAEEASLSGHRFAWLLEATRESAARVAGEGTRVLAFAGGEGRPIADRPAKVVFADEAAVSQGFRGRELDDASLAEAQPLAALPGDQILARVGDAPLWIRAVRAGAAIDFVAVPLPELAEDGYLFQFFHRGNWAGLLPVLHFLKEASPWTPPPLRACFMFDDPNLHWKSYGFADYARLARAGDEHDYHCAFATVPVDGWHVNRKAAALFRKHPRRLSLLIHGNNHTHCELLQTGGDDRRRILAAQAIQRIERLEKKAGFAISRVMAAPHGACNHEMADAMARAGFEAACISRGSIMGRNPGQTWPTTIGLSVSEFMADALPVIPRFNIRLDRDCEFSALLAAFLGQPIIPVGHHDDLAKGLCLLSRLAKTIHSLGDVAWRDMNGIAESNFQTHRDAESLGIQMFARRIRLTVPDGVSQIWIHRPWLKDGAAEKLVVRIGALVQRIDGSRDPVFPVPAGQEVEIASTHPHAFDPHTIAAPRTPLRALVRRHLCEARDRLRPVKERILGR